MFTADCMFSLVQLLQTFQFRSFIQHTWSCVLRWNGWHLEKGTSWTALPFCWKVEWMLTFAFNFPSALFDTHFTLRKISQFKVLECGHLIPSNIFFKNNIWRIFSPRQSLIKWVALAWEAGIWGCKHWCGHNPQSGYLIQSNNNCFTMFWKYLVCARVS